MTKYKIGTFSKFLGVTPDLIKHYEKYGIINAQRDEFSNYRYYSFWQSTKILYSKIFQNMGFSLKEISFLLNDANSKELLQELSLKHDNLSLSIKKQNLILHSIKDITQYEDAIINDDFNGKWEIKTIEPFYYLQHAKNCKYSDELVENSYIQEWVNLLPITKLCTKITLNENFKDEVSFGMCIDNNYAVQFNLACENDIEHIANKKFLVYQSKETVVSKDPFKLPERILKTPLEILNKHNFTVNGDIYLKTLFQSHHNGENVMFRLIYIPVL